MMIQFALPSTSRHEHPLHARVVELLRQPSSYHDGSRRVEERETHISHVFLTERHAYKLKKPVRFSFLDFSDLEKRHAACRDELRLNSRLAPDIYEAVVPVVEKNGRLSLGGSGRVVEWVVKMRRLPDDRSLERLIQASDVSSQQIARLGKTLIRFFADAPPEFVIADEYRRKFERNIESNWDDMLRFGLPEPIVRRVSARQLRFLRLYPEILDRRVCDGGIIEGHGDLRAEHIYMPDPAAPERTAYLADPIVIDCLEFNRDLRQMDVLDELAFLTVECAALGREAIGTQLVRSYCQRAGVQPDSRLLAFYMTYRACVRAKVHAMRAAQAKGDSQLESQQAAQRFLKLADRYASGMGKPLVIVVRGVSGSGKSTLSEALRERYALQALSTDAIRRELLGPSPQPEEADQGRYTPQQRDKIYEELFKRAAEALAEGESLVLDGTFLQAHHRAVAASLAQHHGAEYIAAHCDCPQQVAEQRIAARLDSRGSEATRELVARQLAANEPDPPGAASQRIDTTACVPAQVEQVRQHLRDREQALQEI